LVPLPDADALQRLKVGLAQMLQWSDELAQEREGVQAFLEVMR
jgi:hypothetical protein